MSLPESGCAVTDRDLVIVSGPEALWYVHSQVSQDIDDMEVGESRWSFVLQPQGKLDALFRVVRTGDDELRFDVDGGSGEMLAASVGRFVLRTKVDLEVVASRMLTCFGPTQVAAARDRFGDRAVVSPWDRAEAVDVLGPDDVEFPAELLDPVVFSAVRAARGLPAMGTDLSTDTIPNETGLIDFCVSFTKGCYRGQELVERIHARRARRRVLCRLFATGPIRAGDLVATTAGTDVGFVTSAFEHDGGWYGLGYLTSASAESGTGLAVGEVSVRCSALFEGDG
ncbi:MAG: hypothetical protein GY708_23240 [Actinomycetia bacterium]|nr:hypothetical protein [Actinomycetes bacterium]MCP4958925.1 hypothetical protein [Actinomycetes bacterium]